MTQELVVNDRRAMSRPDPAPVAPIGSVTPMQLLQVAMSQGADLDRLEQLMKLQQQWEGNEARKAFVSAMSQFKANPPTIVKNKLVDFAGRQGGRTTYRHATHDEVTNKITAALAPHGLSHRWDVEQLENGSIRVTCILTHEAGHSERVSMHANRDDSGNKNSIQQVGSAVTYLQRYTLLAVTGLTTADMREADDDGRAAGLRTEGAAEPPSIPEIPPDVRVAITEAVDFNEMSKVWLGLSEETRVLINRHHKAWWTEQKARAKAAGEQQ